MTKCSPVKIKMRLRPSVEMNTLSISEDEINELPPVPDNTYTRDKDNSKPIPFEGEVKDAPRCRIMNKYGSWDDPNIFTILY